jgi:hypothetical protein
VGGGAEDAYLAGGVLDDCQDVTTARTYSRVPVSVTVSKKSAARMAWA